MNFKKFSLINFYMILYIVLIYLVDSTLQCRTLYRYVMQYYCGTVLVLFTIWLKSCSNCDTSCGFNNYGFWSYDFKKSIQL
ncbi:hypothetical protein C2G38_2093911 [Gigaspora rosea]|uniref:Uncharacterized protein n=1 Tax=Gigaspora rosea TaxID=44941 RepID=A0A397V168_9GLOM|nr:hypothetical protein C2G38_2093911 [Gigaspora rosea]